jgi:putative hydrolase of the HAD superfamily
MSAAPSAQALLCDLGGVLIGVDFNRAIDAWAPLSQLPRPALLAAFQLDRAYERHERGEIGAAEYFAHLRMTLELDATDAEIAAGWNAILLDEKQETLALIERARKRVPTYLFSNSNATHKAVWMARYPRVVNAFDGMFVSSDLGFRKPEPEAFREVAGRIGVSPSAILFFDDSLKNVEGARAVGMQAVHVRSSKDVADAIDAMMPSQP